jgi:hypothetical protein
MRASRSLHLEHLPYVDAAAAELGERCLDIDNDEVADLALGLARPT